MNNAKTYSALILGFLLLFPLPLRSFASVWHVDHLSGPGDGTSWSEAFSTIQEAIAAAAENDEIWVKEGTYSLTSQIEVDKIVEIYGGFNGTEVARDQRDYESYITTVDGDGSVRCFYVTADAMIDGLTITNGYVSGSGGAIYIESSSPTIGNCTFDRNIADGDIGRGGAIQNTDASAVIINCYFSNNIANGSLGSGGAIHNDYSSPTITGCTFLLNTTQNNSGAIGSINYSSTTISGCTFIGNSSTGIPGEDYEGYAGAIGSFITSTTTIDDCVFIGNSAVIDGGAIENAQSSTTITNCLFSGNSATNGGAIANNHSSTATITDCTFSENAASDHGGAIATNTEASTIITNCVFDRNSSENSGGAMSQKEPNTSLTIYNCTFSENVSNDSSGTISNQSGPDLTIVNSVLWDGGDEISNDGSPVPIITYSIVQGGYEGDGNISTDPLFWDEDNGDLHLQVGSPGIDSGTSVDAPDADIEGTARPVGNGYDIGAYEYAEEEGSSGKADIIWRDTNTGEVYLWLMDGLDLGSIRTFSVSSEWQIKGLGDFDGDGRSDILWRNSDSGEIYVWLMDGLHLASHGSVLTLPSDSGWQIKDLGDFDGDGRSDILWRNSDSGEVYVWLMDGTSIGDYGQVAVSSEWQIEGVGDFDGDSKADILWRSSDSGEVYVWIMDGLNPASYGLVFTFSDPADRQVKGVGDFNGSN